MMYNYVMKTNPLNQYLLYQLYHARVLVHSLKYDGKEEELHEFRVALRRIRSLIKLFFDDSVPFTKSLKTMMKATNTIRELDVLLKSISSAQLPKLFKQLSKHRQKIVQTLFTPAFVHQTLLLLDESSDYFFQNDSYFISEILMQKTLTHYQHCLDTYESLEKNTKSKTLHHLRVQFKNARYGFEFLEIADIHEAKEIIEHCKTVQNSLGGIQDAVNQIKLLKQMRREYHTSEIKELLKQRKNSLEKLQKSHKS